MKIGFSFLKNPETSLFLKTNSNSHLYYSAYAVKKEKSSAKRERRNSMAPPQIGLQRLASRITNCFQVPKELFFMAFDTLISCDTLGIMLGGLPESDGPPRLYLSTKVRYDTVYPVLSHIIRRTLPFHKLFECVTHSQIIDGLPQLAISKCSYSVSTVKRTLGDLSPPKDQTTVRLTLPRKIAVSAVYGLNFPIIFKYARLCWGLRVNGDHFDIEYLNPSYLFLRGYAQLSVLDYFFRLYQPAYDFLSSQIAPLEPKKMNTFIDELKSIIDAVDLDIELLTEMLHALKKLTQSTERRNKMVLRKYWNKCRGNEHDDVYQFFDLYPSDFNRLQRTLQK